MSKEKEALRNAIPGTTQDECEVAYQKAHACSVERNKNCRDAAREMAQVLVAHGVVYKDVDKALSLVRDFLGVTTLSRDNSIEPKDFI